MKIEPGFEFVIKGVSHTVVEKSPIPGRWTIRQTYNPVARLIFKDEKWIREHASNTKKSS